MHTGSANGSQPPRGDPAPLWQVMLIGLATLLAWPAVIAPQLWRAGRFHRVVRKATDWRHRIVADGVEVWRGAEPPQPISWAELGEGRWLVHTSPSMASGQDESVAVDLPSKGLALAGELLPVLKALSERQLRPALQNGGRALGAAGWVMTMLWLGGALIVALVVLWRRL